MKFSVCLSPLLPRHGSECDVKPVPFGTCPRRGAWGGGVLSNPLYFGTGTLQELARVSLFFCAFGMVEEKHPFWLKCFIVNISK